MLQAAATIERQQLQASEHGNADRQLLQAAVVNNSAAAGQSER
jgi:hypothetical protein